MEGNGLGGIAEFNLGGGTVQVFDSALTTTVNATLMPGTTSTIDTNGLGATWSGVLSGAGSLAKAGSGTLILSGANDYTGATTVAAGTLAAGAVNTLPNMTAVTVQAPGTLDLASFNQSIGSLSGAGAVTLGSATLTTGSDNTSTTFSGAISGAGGALDKVGTGTIILDGDNSYTGGTTVSAGALVIGDFANPTAALSGGGAIAVGAGATLGGYGSVIGDVTNRGVIAPGSAAPGLSGSPMGAFTIVGDYTGAGGTMAVNTVLGGDGSPSDRLVISGGTASGNTIVHVTNVGGVGAETTGNGIPVVNAVGGATTAARPSPFPLANSGRGPSTMICSAASVGGIQPKRLVPALRLRRGAPGERRACPVTPPLVPIGPTLPSTPLSKPAAARRRVSIIGPASSRNLWEWCSLWRGNWASASSAHSTIEGATPTSRMVAPLRLRSKTRLSICRPGSQWVYRPGRGRR